MRYYSADEVSKMLSDVAEYGLTAVLKSSSYKSVEIAEPHGRLIDADELAIPVGEDAWHMVHNAPTVMGATYDQE